MENKELRQKLASYLIIEAAKKAGCGGGTKMRMKSTKKSKKKSK